MKAKAPERILLVLALASFFLMFASFFVLSLRKNQTQHRTLLDFEASRAASELLENFAMTGMAAPLNPDDRVLGFGIYDGDGLLLSRFGTAPEFLDLTALQGAQGKKTGDSGLVETRNSVVMVRPVGIQPMGGRGMGMMGMRQSYKDRQPPILARGLTLFLELSTREIIRERRASLASLGGFFAGFVVLMAVIFYMFRRYRNFQQKSEEQAHLLQLGEAARTLAHEIKNPLSALRLQVSILKKKSGGLMAENVSVLDEEISRLTMLVDRVGEYLKNPKGSPETFAPGEFLTRVCPLYPFPVRLSGGEAPNVLIRFDRDRFRSLCDNLINNAWESMNEAAAAVAFENAAFSNAGTEDAAEVEVELKEDKNSVFLMVKDRGCGIPEEKREEIFAMFYTTKTKGSGIGLAIARRFMDAAGGAIYASARSGGGTEIICVFPKARRHENLDS